MERMMVFVGLRAAVPVTATQRRVAQFILPLGLAHPFLMPSAAFHLCSPPTFSSSFSSLLRPKASPQSPQNLYYCESHSLSMAKKEVENKGRGVGKEKRGWGSVDRESKRRRNWGRRKEKRKRRRKNSS